MTKMLINSFPKSKYSKKMTLETLELLKTAKSMPKEKNIKEANEIYEERREKANLIYQGNNQAAESYAKVARLTS